MKNHFYISYCGNKRQEIERIYEHLNFDGIDTVVEPFAGSCAMSYYIWTKRPDLNFVINDIDPFLKQMFDLLHDDDKIKEFEEEFNQKCISFRGKKEVYDGIVRKEKTLMAWFIAHKIYCIRPTLFPTNRVYKETINLKETPVYKFFKTAKITYTQLDGVECYNNYKDKENCLILLDPPYMASCNDLYSSSTNVYEYLYNHNIKNEKAQIYLILEDIWIVRLLFQTNTIVIDYKKNYEMTHRKTSHVVIGK